MRKFNFFFHIKKSFNNFSKKVSQSLMLTLYQPAIPDILYLLNPINISTDNTFLYFCGTNFQLGRFCWEDKSNLNWETDNGINVWFLGTDFTTQCAKHSWAWCSRKRALPLIWMFSHPVLLGRCRAAVPPAAAPRSLLRGCLPSAASITSASATSASAHPPGFRPMALG